MSVIVYNKNTGKYLRRRSGSYNDQRWTAHWKIQQTIESKQNKETMSKDAYNEWLWAEVDKILFSANPEDARVYASKGSALTSVGTYHRLGAKMTWPDRLEAHEIEKVYVCVIKPDGTSNCDDDGGSHAT